MKCRLMFLADQDAVFSIELDNPPMAICVGDLFNSREWSKHEMEVCGSHSRVTAIEHHIPKDGNIHTMNIHLKQAKTEEYNQDTC